MKGQIFTIDSSTFLRSTPGITTSLTVENFTLGYFVALHQCTGEVHAAAIRREGYKRSLVAFAVDFLIQDFGFAPALIRSGRFVNLSSFFFRRIGSNHHLIRLKTDVVETAIAVQGGRIL